MKPKIELEFIDKVSNLSEQMRDLANFWAKNQEALEDANVSEDYPFSESFDDLAINVQKWLLTLIVAKYLRK